MDQNKREDVGKLDYERRRGKNGSDVCRCQQWEPNLIFSTKKQQIKCKKPGNPEGRADSGKSEEEAATAIQAVYRGYKARRRFDEIRKTTSEERQNIRKVAELLAIPVGQPLHGPLEPVRMSNSLASQTRNEKDGKRQTLSPRKKRRESSVLGNRNQRDSEDQQNKPRDIENHRIPEHGEKSRIMEIPTSVNQTTLYDYSKPIQTIKAPAFPCNYDGRTSSVTPSENTDTDDPFSPRIDEKSIVKNYENFENIQEIGIIAKNDEVHDDVQKTSGFKEVQTGSLCCKRILPQRISSSMIGPNAESYYFDKSLYFPDRESVLVFGGVDPHEEYGRPGNTGKNIYRFRPDENVWEVVGEIPKERHHHSVAYLKGRVYIVGGADPGEDQLRRKNIAVGTVWSFDPTTRMWFTEPGMLTARKDFGLVVSHGKMYAVGGQERNGTVLRTVEAFDPTDRTWREMQPMHTARMGAASVKYRDLIWVAGGMTKSKKELFSKDVECYDPIKNLSPRCFASLYVVSDRLYVIGGASTVENDTRSVDCIDLWDADECIWRERANMATARHGHSTGSIGNQLLIIGGVTTVFMKSLSNVECYCCDTGKWMKGVSALPYALSGHGAVSLPPANLLTTT